MAPGPPNLGDNRFALLSPPRKKRNNGFKFDFPELPATNASNPKYIVLSAVDESRTIASYSCFGIYSALKAIDKDLLSITALRDGNLLILVKSQVVADKFLAQTSLPGICKIKCKLHETLNSMKGTLYAPYLNDVPEDEIVKGLANEKVSGAHKFTKTVDGVQKPTGVVLLTFNLYTLPSKIDIAWYSAKIREYYPNPMRCKTCQRLGHTAKHCKNPAACVACSLPPHLPDRACTQILCMNCKGDHEANSMECPKYKELKELLRIKINKKCTMREARNFMQQNCSSNTSPSYSSVISMNYNKNNNNTNTSTSNNTNQQQQNLHLTVFLKTPIRKTTIIHARSLSTLLL